LYLPKGASISVQIKVQAHIKNTFLQKENEPCMEGEATPTLYTLRPKPPKKKKKNVRIFSAGEGRRIIISPPPSAMAEKN
jgi:hypothetical protein